MLCMLALMAQTKNQSHLCQCSEVALTWRCTAVLGMTRVEAELLVAIEAGPISGQCLCAGLDDNSSGYSVNGAHVQ